MKTLVSVITGRKDYPTFDTNDEGSIIVFLKQREWSSSEVNIDVEDEKDIVVEDENGRDVFNIIDTELVNLKPSEGEGELGKLKPYKNFKLSKMEYNEEHEVKLKEFPMLVNSKDYKFESKILGTTSINVSGKIIDVIVFRNKNGNIEVNLPQETIEKGGWCEEGTTTEGCNEEIIIGQYTH